MKELLRNIFVYSLIVYFVLTLFSLGIKLPENPSYLLITVLILSFTVVIACPMLSFLTVKCNFPTFFLMSSLLLCGIFYVLKIFMIDFYIEEFLFEGFMLGNLEIKSFDFSPFLTMLSASAVIGFLSALFATLDNK